MALPSDAQLDEILHSIIDNNKSNIEALQNPDIVFKTGTDPFGFLLRALIEPIDFNQWVMLERLRRIDKSLTNAIGGFHERIINSVEGWEKPVTGFDTRCDSRKIIAEIKNKYNTMNSSSSKALYDHMRSFYRDYPDWTIYLVQIIPKSGQVNKPWVIPNAKEIENIRVIDGYQFYELVTGENDALIKIIERIYARLDQDQAANLPFSLTDLTKLIKETYCR